jgi:hypothetical protein
MNYAKSFDKLKKMLGIKDSLQLFNRMERGIYSTNPIEKNSVVIRIKSKHLLEFQKINKLYPIDGIENVNSIVAFHLARLFYEKDEFWSCYIDLLPSDISEFVFFWDPQDLDLIKNTSMELDINQHIDFVLNDFELIYLFNKEHGIISDPSINTYENFYSIWLRFRLLVGSRIFGYNKHGEETSGIVPYVDMINHSIEPNTTWYFDNSSDTFVLVSTEYIPKNKEIVDNYGVTNNVDLIIYYGFTIGQNPNPYIKFSIGEIEYEFDTNSTFIEFSDRQIEQIVVKIKQIYLHHLKILPKIKNSNIANIYLDEIYVIKYLIKCLNIVDYEKK